MMNVFKIVQLVNPHLKENLSLVADKPCGRLCSADIYGEGDSFHDSAPFMLPDQAG